jgi:hypothetical protein
VRITALERLRKREGRGLLGMMDGGGCGGGVDDDGQGFFISVKLSLVRSDVTDVVWLVRSGIIEGRSWRPWKIRSPMISRGNQINSTGIPMYLNAVWIYRCKLIITLILISRTQLDTP